MDAVCSPDSQELRRRRDTWALALCWVCGLLFGILVYLGAGYSLDSLMRSTMDGTVSIVSLLFVTILPFLLSAFAVSLSLPALFPICFGKAFLFAFVALGVFRAFGSAGWLLFRLILFSDWALLPLLYFLWLRLVRGHSRLSGVELMLLLSLAVLIFSVDHCIISPIAASLIEI